MSSPSARAPAICKTVSLFGHAYPHAFAAPDCRTKLSLSHALSQSVKISVFEELISATIEDTKDIPEVISETGKIGMPHKGTIHA
jgi:uncharacterized Rmd1/YagE family protein